MDLCGFSKHGATEYVEWLQLLSNSMVYKPEFDNTLIGVLQGLPALDGLFYVNDLIERGADTDVFLTSKEYMLSHKSISHDTLSVLDHVSVCDNATADLIREYKQSCSNIKHITYAAGGELVDIESCDEPNDDFDLHNDKAPDISNFKDIIGSVSDIDMPVDMDSDSEDALDEPKSEFDDADMTVTDDDIDSGDDEDALDEPETDEPEIDEPDNDMTVTDDDIDSGDDEDALDEPETDEPDIEHDSDNDMTVTDDDIDSGDDEDALEESETDEPDSNSGDFDDMTVTDDDIDSGDDEDALEEHDIDESDLYSDNDMTVTDDDIDSGDDEDALDESDTGIDVETEFGQEINGVYDDKQRLRGKNACSDAPNSSFNQSTPYKECKVDNGVFNNTVESKSGIPIDRLHKSAAVVAMQGVVGESEARKASLMAMKLLHVHDTARKAGAAVGRHIRDSIDVNNESEDGGNKSV